MANDTVAETKASKDPELEFTAEAFRQIVDELDRGVLPEAQIAIRLGALIRAGADEILAKKEEWHEQGGSHRRTDRVQADPFVNGWLNEVVDKVKFVDAYAPDEAVARVLEQRVLARTNSEGGRGWGTRIENAPLGDLLIELTTGGIEDDIESRPEAWVTFEYRALTQFGHELETLVGDPHQSNELCPILIHRLARRMLATAELSYRFRQARYHQGPTWGGPVAESEAAE